MKNDYSLLEESKHLKKDAFAKLVQAELSKEEPCYRWIGEKQEIQIQGLTLNRGNFYIGNYVEVQETTPIGVKCPSKNRIVYSAVINPYLPIAKGKFKQKYFSSYYNLTENARYLYLSWLASVIPTNEVPDELLYFHIWGIQIRLFLDTETTQKDREDLINVLLSIRSEINSESNIFWYINHIIDLTISKFFVYEDKKFTLSNIQLPLYEHVLINDITTINAEKAFGIFTSVYPNRFSEHLLPYIQSYFKKRFRSRKLKSEESAYSPFFDDIEIPLTLGLASMFIPIGLNCKYSQCKNVSDEQCRKISNFFNTLIVKFRNYEKIANDTISPFSPLSYFCLPEFIQREKKEIPNKLLSDLKNLVDKQEVVVSYGTFSGLWGLNYKGENLKRSHIDIIMFELNKLGYGLIPNYSINNKRISSKEPCVIYKRAEQTFMNVDTNFHRMELLTKLMAFVIQGAPVSDADFLLIRTILSKINDHTQNLAYLNGYMLWLLQKKQVLDKSTKEGIESLSTLNKDLFLRILLTLASPNGNINTNRVNSLKKILPSLGKEENSIHSLLHQMLTSGMDFIIDKEGGRPETLIEQEKSRSGIKIDNHKLNAYREQTLESQSILSNIFSEETEKNTIVDEGNKDVLKEMLSWLFTKELWDKDELETICKEKRLMLGSILEEINDYSYSVVDDVVLEDNGDSISVIMDYKEDLL